MTTEWQNQSKWEEQSRHMHIRPEDITQNIAKRIEQQLRSELVQKWSPKLGYISKIEMLMPIGNGTVSARTGLVSFDVKYRALAFQPKIGLVVTAISFLVTELGIHAHIGPMSAFLSERMLPSTFVYKATSGVFHNATTNTTISKHTAILVRIIGTKWTSDNKYEAVVCLVLPSLAPLKNLDVPNLTQDTVEKM